MFDPSIMLSLEAAKPPQMPVLRQERVISSPFGDEAKKFADGVLQEYNANADKWLSELEAVKVKVGNVEKIELASPEQLAKLDDFINSYEEMADVRSRKIVHLQKRIKRDVTNMFLDDASLAAILRSGGNSLVATEKRVVRGLCDYALFLRAVRAESDPAGYGGPIFDNVNDLSHYLDGLTA